MYTHSEPDKLVIITIWMEDLFLLADLAGTMKEIKKGYTYRVGNNKFEQTIRNCQH